MKHKKLIVLATLFSAGFMLATSQAVKADSVTGTIKLLIIQVYVQILIIRNNIKKIFKMLKILQLRMVGLIKMVSDCIWSKIVQLRA